jgi:probable HAF family extracellular repeat protein
LWRNGIIQDLGASLGGDFTGSEGINDRGAVAGWAYLAGNASYHAALWQQVGKITDLGVVAGDDCSFASSINAKTQIVGASLPSCAFDNNTRAFLWQNGSILDLNTLIPPGASLHLQWALDINDLGEIAGIGLDVDNNSHAFLLIPCRGDDPSDCQEEIVTAGGSQPGVVPLTRHPQAGNPPNSVRRMLRPRLGLAPHLLKPRSGLAGGRIGATAGTASEAGSMQTLSIPAGEGKLSDYLPGEDMLPNLVRGLCSVDPGTKKLTGGCVGSQGSHCVSKRDSAHCPAGQPAKRAEWLQLCVYLQGYVDGARTCTAL